VRAAACVALAKYRASSTVAKPPRKRSKSITTTLLLNLKKEAFHASILNIVLDGKKQQVLLRDTQVHAYKPLVLHVDFQRVMPPTNCTSRCRCTSSTKKPHRASSSTAAWSTTS
jgi:hypothetical protein